MDFEVVKDEKVNNAKEEVMEKAVAFEELVRTKGWGYIKAYAQDALNGFNVKAVKVGFKDMEEYQFERGRVAGIFSILNEVELALQTLQDERNK